MGIACRALTHSKTSVKSSHLEQGELGKAPFPRDPLLLIRSPTDRLCKYLSNSYLFPAFSFADAPRILDDRLGQSSHSGRSIYCDDADMISRRTSSIDMRTLKFRQWRIGRSLLVGATIRRARRSRPLSFDACSAFRADQAFLLYRRITFRGNFFNQKSTFYLSLS